VWIGGKNPHARAKFNEKPGSFRGEAAGQAPQRRSAYIYAELLAEKFQAIKNPPQLVGGLSARIITFHMIYSPLSSIFLNSLSSSFTRFSSS
jgi:hypothetical protein